MAPSVKQHLSSAVYQRSVFAFHLISQLVQNIRISRYSFPSGQWDTPRDIFPSSVCGWPCSHALQWGAAGISGSTVLTGWPIPKPSVITGIKLFKATDFHFYSSHWKNVAPSLLTYTRTVTGSGSSRITSVSFLASRYYCRWCTWSML